MAGFWETYARITEEAKASEVGKLMVAAGYDVAHTGGGCMCWEKMIGETGYLWICDVGNGLGDTPDEEYLVGLYAADGDGLDGDTMPNLKTALEWCECRIEPAPELVLCRELRAWCEKQGLPQMSADELMHEEVTADQRKWLSAYVERWNAMLNAQGVA